MEEMVVLEVEILVVEVVLKTLVILMDKVMEEMVYLLL
tara:strand:- start:1307 stop:1420 length:114 start_codon:yes stop_codon:yes gene_type:complete